MEGFTYGGVIVSNGDVGYQGRKEEDKLMSVGNNHGGLVCVNDQWYIFYHRHTYLNQYNRQACAEKFISDRTAVPTGNDHDKCGMNPEPLSGNATYPAVYCCNLTNGHMGPLSSLGRTNPEVDFPYLTSVEDERYITNVKDGDLIGYKYINLAETKKVSVSYLSDGRRKALRSIRKTADRKKKSICRRRTNGRGQMPRQLLRRRRNCILFIKEQEAFPF